MSATARRTVSAYANHSEEKEPSRSTAGRRELRFPTPVQTWLTSDVSGVRSQVVALPGPDESEVAINEQLVVEFYSR
jgi:ribosomal protein S4